MGGITMVKDYKYYKNLPELDEAKIESLIRPSNEVDDFIKKGKEKLNDPEFDKKTMLLYTIDEIRDFVGEEFWSATEQPQHIAMTEEERCLERMKAYYDKIFKAYYNQLDGMGENHDFSGSRKAFLRTSKKFQIQFKNMLFEMKITEEEFWEKFEKHAESYWRSLYYPLLHTQRTLYGDEPLPMVRVHYMFWINHMVEEFINDTYIYSLNMQAGYFS
jgi:hypothetical protein